MGHDGIPWAWLALQLPIVALMAAGAQRTPTGGGWARWLWRNGRVIITLTALLNLVWTARLLWHSDNWALWPELLLGLRPGDRAGDVAGSLLRTVVQRVSGAR